MADKFHDLNDDVIQSARWEITWREGKLMALRVWRRKARSLPWFLRGPVMWSLLQSMKRAQAQRALWVMYEKTLLGGVPSEVIPVLDRMVKYFRPNYLYMTYVAWISLSVTGAATAIPYVRAKFHGLLDLRESYRQQA